MVRRTDHRPNGPQSLSPGERPGYAQQNGPRPVGPPYERRNPRYRAPSGRLNSWMTRHPARWAGLRHHGPLARIAT